eukprot:234858-Pleurochrysis_carterae.AAC.1
MTPIRLRAGVYRTSKDLRITRVADVVGFKPIGDGVDEVGSNSPWSAKFSFYKSVGINHYRNPGYCAGPVAER